MRFVNIIQTLLATQNTVADDIWKYLFPTLVLVALSTLLVVTIQSTFFTQYIPLSDEPLAIASAVQYQRDLVGTLNLTNGSNNQRTNRFTMATAAGAASLSGGRGAASPSSSGLQSTGTTSHIGINNNNNSTVTETEDTDNADRYGSARVPNSIDVHDAHLHHLLGATFSSSLLSSSLSSPTHHTATPSTPYL